MKYYNVCERNLLSMFIVICDSDSVKSFNASVLILYSANYPDVEILAHFYESAYFDGLVILSIVSFLKDRFQFLSQNVVQVYVKNRGRVVFY